MRFNVQEHGCETKISPPFSRSCEQKGKTKKTERCMIEEVVNILLDVNTATVGMISYAMGKNRA